MASEINKPIQLKCIHCGVIEIDPTARTMYHKYRALLLNPYTILPLTCPNCSDECYFNYSVDQIAKFRLGKIKFEDLS